MQDAQPTPNTDGDIVERLEAKMFGNAEPAPEAESAAPEMASEPEKAQEPKAKPEAAQADQKTFSTSDIAAILGVEESALDVEDDGSIRVKTKVDGVEGKAKFQDLLKAYQLGEHADKRAQRAAEAEKAIQARAQQMESAIQERAQAVEAMAKLAGEELLKEYQSVDWNDLKQTDPGRFAALQLEFQGRQQKVVQAINAARGQTAQMSQQIEQARQQFVAQEVQRIGELLPDWKDESVRSADQKAIAAAAQKNGVPPMLMEILSNGLTTPNGYIPPSAGLVALLRDGVRYQALQAKKPETEAAVRAAPKLVKAGAAVQNTQADKLAGLKAQAKKSGSTDDVAALLRARWG